MNSLYLAFGTAVLFLIAYHTYGKFLARKIFKLNPDAVCPIGAYVPIKMPAFFGLSPLGHDN